jgi:serine protease DegS
MMYRLKLLATAGLGFGAGAFAVLLALDPGLLPDRITPGRVGAVADAPGAVASYADAVTRAAPAVLRVFGRREGATSTPSPAAAQRHQSAGLSRGSAVVVSDDGLLVTNGHIVAGADAIGVEVPGQGIQDASLLGIDAATDLAVLRLAVPVGPAVSIGEPDQLRPGDVVLAIGNPFGLEQTVSLGVISATGRMHLGLTEIEDFIQTDAAINPGNSGGALIDSKGRLVGINTAIMSDSGRSEGVAFAIPADRVLHVVHEIATNGSVARGWIGIGARTLDATLAQRFGVRAPQGVFVTRVLEDSPAAAADLRVGDVVVGVAGRRVSSSPALREAVISAGADGQIELDLWRGSERLRTLVHTRLRPSAVHAAATGNALAAQGCARRPDGC